MHVRTTTMEVPPDKLDEALRYFREQDLPQMRQTDGFKGLIILVDRQSGKGLGMSLWESEDHLRATEAAANQGRGEVAEAAGVAPAGGEAFEVALFEIGS